MEKLSKPALAAFVLLVPVFLMSGCVDDVEINAVLETPPLVEPLPITLGVYYSDDFRNYRYEKHFSGSIRTLIFLPGRSSIDLFDQTFTAMFAKTILVESLPPAPAVAQGLDVVIEPKIASFVVIEPYGICNIDYSISLYSPAGEQLSRWTVNGHGDSETSYAGDSLKIAMRAAVATFLVDFYEDPAVKRCLQRIAKTGGASGKSGKCFEKD